MSSYSARDAHRRGSIVPPLAGVDRPALEVVPDKCDVLICGTGLAESILAAALAWQGTDVLHIDSNPFYGDAWACLSQKELQSFISERYDSSALLETLASAQMYAPRKDKRLILDLSPHILFAKSDMLDLLVKSRVFKYLEFKALGQFHTFEKDSFEKVSGNKEAIFTDQSLTPTTKRRLMKFIKWVFEGQVDDKTAEDLRNVSAHKLLSEQFKLEDPQIQELVIAIGLCDDVHVPASRAIKRIRRYLLSLDFYGHFPVLYSMYGSGGELSQAFCRSAAVAGATYKLSTKLEDYNPDTQIATLSDGSRIQVAEKVVLSQTQSTSLNLKSNKNHETEGHVTRLVAVVSNECKEWFAEKESAAVVVFPPGSLPNNKSAVHTIVYGPGAGCVPQGHSCWYLSSHEPDERSARQDLGDALERLEATILRESSTEFDLGELSASDVSFKPDGTPVVSSVRLGQSMSTFVPRNKLQYLAKLCYRQATSSKVEEPFEHSRNVLFSPLQLAEISYDGVISQARKLYESIVGSDDDFFDVDFEDENDESPHLGVGGLDEDVMHMEI